MASILRQIVAGPRARHPEAGLDLCYVTDSIVATFVPPSGPSQTYPQRAYRNPLDQLVAFLDSKHGQDWAIWEFRAEGTGYPDEAVYGRIRHYPWPDHHPPPFRLVPLIMASMRNWLHGGSLEGGPCSSDEAGKAAGRRVAVVHCKAGKGRSGTVTCSYLISEAGWTAEAALARFTERRMRPKFGAGVSIPSQLRWIGYVDRWTRHGKKYVDCAVEIVELHVWGLRNGVRVDVEGYVEDGRVIRVFHTFPRHERLVVTAGAPVGDGVGQAIWDLAGYPATSAADAAPEAADLAEATNKPLQEEEDKEKNDERPSLPDRPGTEPPGQLGTRHKLMRKGTDLMQRVSPTTADGPKQSQPSDAPSESTTTTRVEPPEEPEPGGMAVIFRPEEPIRLPTGDVNVSVERRNKSSKSIGLTMVTAVAHVWFNAFFEGQGPERNGAPADSGVFTIDWEAMDGIKGSSRKGGRALDRLAVVWRLASDAPRPEEIVEPAEEPGE
ncbi:hypothetical protein CDD80_1705 [Ophiocordyceps camponoti-rufipedis]|uniref:phosphatidylinositol-3,4,5-trisphosphate 3-phosphatase n=1 Tax=Ophiocordyceps camponoti-rufipedis TaxID=2004952 RepID=A0A2C5XLI9_9HYPO|nr:hypothetical protein CDD80_1705 [Ophiocordyceps camponoti-rufipedis]